MDQYAINRLHSKYGELTVSFRDYTYPEVSWRLAYFRESTNWLPSRLIKTYLSVRFKSPGPRSTRQSFVRGGSAPNSNPLLSFKLT